MKIKTSRWGKRCARAATVVATTATAGLLSFSSPAQALDTDQINFLNRVTAPCKNQDFVFQDRVSLIQPWYYIDYVGEYKRVWSDNAVIRKYKVYDAWFVGNSWLPVNWFPYYNTTHHRNCNSNPSGK